MSFTKTLEDILREGGEIIRRHFAGRLSDYTRKSDDSPVTAADTETNTFLEAALMKLLPEASWLSEETHDDAGMEKAPWIWIVDPLDGTREFLDGIPELAISVGLVRDGRAVGGGIYNPLTGEGGVCWPGEKPHFFGFDTEKAPGVPTSLADATVIVSRSETRKGILVPFHDAFREFKPVGSVAYKLLRVAAGADPLTISLEPKNEWDICGGCALLAGTGQVYLRLDGKPIEFNRQTSRRIHCGAVAGPESLAREFLKLHAKRTSGHPG